MKEAGVIMSKRDVFEFEQIERFLAGQQSRSDTALLLGQTTRTVSRKARKVESKGDKIAGYLHRKFFLKNYF